MQAVARARQRGKSLARGVDVAAGGRASLPLAMVQRPRPVDPGSAGARRVVNSLDAWPRWYGPPCRLRHHPVARMEQSGIRDRSIRAPRHPGQRDATRESCTQTALQRPKLGGGHLVVIEVVIHPVLEDTQVAILHEVAVIHDAVMLVGGRMVVAEARIHLASVLIL